MPRGKEKMKILEIILAFIIIVVFSAFILGCYLIQCDIYEERKKDEDNIKNNTSDNK